MATPRTRRVLIAAGTALLALAAGCANPYAAESTEALRRSVAEAAQRELTDARTNPAPREVTRTTAKLDFSSERLEELRKMAGPAAYGDLVPDVGRDLLGDETRTVAINLKDAVSRALRRNLAVQSAQLTPAITEAQIVIAEAAFDWTLFASGSASSLDEPQPVSVINGVLVGSSVNKRQVYAYQTGVRRALTSGGELTISQGLTNTDNQSPGVFVAPDPSRAASLDVTLGQPLLRNFGSDVNLSEVRLAQNAERDAIQQLRAQLQETITRTEAAYWSVFSARSTLLISQRVLQRGVETRDVLKGRLDFDVKPAEYSDAVARVEARRANVIRAANLYRQRSDELKALINDPALPVGDEALLVPLDTPVDAPISFSLFDALASAIALRPEVQRAVLAIDDASIRQTVADNQRLPSLDLTLQARFNGLDANAGGAYREISDASFVNYLLGLAFEYPLGNRAAEALSRQRRLERMQAVVNYRAAIQAATLAVKSALRDITTNYQLIEQTRASRLAATENLRTLQVEEENTRALTPDFLDLKLRRQEALAQAEIEEVRSLVDYNTAIADLYQAMGKALERNNVDFVVPNPGDEQGEWGR